MSPQIIHNANPDALFASAAAKLLFEMEQCVKNGGCNLALPGGRSVVSLLLKLLELRAQVDKKVWQSVHFFMIDERLVPLEHTDSNYKLLDENFFSVLRAENLISAEQLHPFVFESDSLESSIADYQTELEDRGGSYDLIVLGVGEDAHVGALFPEHASVKSSAPYFVTMNDSPKPPPKRMSASVALLSAAKVSFVIFAGEGKRDALRKFNDDTVSLVKCPAKIATKTAKGFLVTDLI